MKKIIIKDDFWAIFPTAKIGVVIAHNIDNHIYDTAQYQALLNAAQQNAQQYISAEEFMANPVIRTWREAYQQFKTKKGARSSIEALLKRVKNNNEIRTINPLVDIYNSVSLKYGMPCGGEDISKIVGDMLLTKAIGTEDFITLGSEQKELPYEGEIVYKDEIGAICRCLNWRESTRTMLTEQAIDAVLCIEFLEFDRETDFENALSELQTLIATNLRGSCEIKILDRNNPCTNLEN
ncbi:B3/4 domain-containing protein [Spiroplasma sp. DGKH1]|uniref:B3/4 domain-containing protein n=1 Tax=Spiroplasma sp. DGKH1 TaxID=3050074 RepID=UPI0034C5FA13